MHVLSENFALKNPQDVGLHIVQGEDDEGK